MWITCDKGQNVDQMFFLSGNSQFWLYIYVFVWVSIIWGIIFLINIVVYCLFSYTVKYIVASLEHKGISSLTFMMLYTYTYDIL